MTPARATLACLALLLWGCGAGPAGACQSAENLRCLTGHRCSYNRDKRCMDCQCDEPALRRDELDPYGER